MTSLKLFQEVTKVLKMAASNMRFAGQKLLKIYNYHNSYPVIQKSFYCTAKSDNETPSTSDKLGFAKFSDRKEEFLQPKQEIKPEAETFVSLLKNSKFIDMGDPVGKVVIGEIYHVVGDDLYIDFGWKFSTVCAVPHKNKQMYIPGAKVKLLIKDLELTAKFLGSDEYISLNEADCVLLGLATTKKIHNKSDVPP